MRFRLRTLLIALALGPPIIAGFYCYPAEFTFLAIIVVFSLIGAAIGGKFGMTLEGAILAFAFLFLLALLMPAINRSGPTPELTALVTIHQFTQAIKSYQTNVGDLPPDLGALHKLPRNLPTNTTWGGPYFDLEEFPVDPWGNKFEYQILDRSNGVFRVWSKGPDRRSYTADDISSR